MYGIIIVSVCLSTFTYAETAPQSLPAEEEDFSSTPFTEYGEFNEDAEEALDTLFFQHGRFFGVGLASGVSGVTGNRGLLWQGGFPLIDFRLHYWFDFNFAMDFGFMSASHFYEFNRSANQSDLVNVNLINVGVNVKYYIDTKNLSSAISFANPFVSLGFGILYKTENSQSLGAAGSDPDSAFNLAAGVGLEFPIKYRKIYFALEAKLKNANFNDTFSTAFQNSGIQDLQGYFYTLTGSFIFTW
jgi:hypothetical protein